MRLIAAGVFALGIGGAATPTSAATYVCLRTITDVELLHRVKQDSYFTQGAPPGKRLRLEYDGCGYRVHVGEGSATSRGGDLLLVDKEGRVTKVVRPR